MFFFADFMKAFDKVNHRVLIKKLMQFELHPNTIRWIWSYLRNREHIVKHGTHCSTPFTSNSGVAQGSHLGPTLFTMLINDLEEMIDHAHLLLFADDSKTYAIVNNDIDARNLQVQYCQAL